MSPYLKNEAKALCGAIKGKQYRAMLRKIRKENFFAWLFRKLRIRYMRHWYELDHIEDYQVASSDYRKFDGSLKMVIAGAPESRFLLEKYLEGLENALAARMMKKKSQ